MGYTIRHMRDTRRNQIIIYGTLVRRINVGARQLESAPQDVGQEQDCRLGEIENASP